MDHLLYIPYPDLLVHQRQCAVLAALSDPMRASVARSFVLMNASRLYYQQLKNEPSFLDYQQWLVGLPAEVAADMKKIGYNACIQNPDLQRFVLEICDLGLYEFMNSILQPADYQA